MKIIATTKSFSNLRPKTTPLMTMPNLNFQIKSFYCSYTIVTLYCKCQLSNNILFEKLNDTTHLYVDSHFVPILPPTTTLAAS